MALASLFVTDMHVCRLSCPTPQSSLKILREMYKDTTALVHLSSSSFALGLVLLYSDLDLDIYSIVQWTFLQFQVFKTSYPA